MGYKDWVKTLTVKEMKALLVELLELTEMSEYISFGDLAPYWFNTGEPLIEGQKCWEDE